MFSELGFSYYFTFSPSLTGALGSTPPCIFKYIWQTIGPNYTSDQFLTHLLESLRHLLKNSIQSLSFSISSFFKYFIRLATFSIHTFLTPQISSALKVLKVSYTFSKNTSQFKCLEIAMRAGSKNFLILKSIPSWMSAKNRSKNCSH